MDTKYALYLKLNRKLVLDLLYYLNMLLPRTFHVLFPRKTSLYGSSFFLDGVESGMIYKAVRFSPYLIFILKAIRIMFFFLKFLVSFGFV